MSKVFSNTSADTAAEVTASQTGAAVQRGRAKARPSAKADGPVRSHVHRKSQRPPPYSDLGRDAPTSAQRRAAAILEVLAGEQTAAEAARALGVSPMHYYLLERRALQGLVAACAPRPKGPPGPRPEQELVRLRRELERSQRECQRQTALVRATQRALGFPAMAPSKPSKAKDKPEAAGGKRSRRRQATVRALRAAQCLRENSSGPAEADVVEPSSARGSTTEASLPRQAEAAPLPSRIQALEAENRTLRQQLTAAEVRRELAEVLPHVVHTPDEAAKKGAPTQPPRQRGRSR